MGGCVMTQNGRRACPGTPCFRSLLVLAAYQGAGIVQQVQANCSPTSFFPALLVGKAKSHRRSHVTVGTGRDSGPAAVCHGSTRRSIR